MKSGAQVEELFARLEKTIKEENTDLALKARQSGAPSHVLLEIKNDIKDLVVKTKSIEAQTIKTNGRVTRLEKIVLVTGTVLVVLGVVKYPFILSLIHAL